MELEMGRSIKGLYNKQMNYQLSSSIPQPGEYPSPVWAAAEKFILWRSGTRQALDSRAPGVAEG